MAWYAAAMFLCFARSLVAVSFVSVACTAGDGFKSCSTVNDASGVSITSSMEMRPISPKIRNADRYACGGRCVAAGGVT